MVEWLRGEVIAAVVVEIVDDRDVILRFREPSRQTKRPARAGKAEAEATAEAASEESKDAGPGTRIMRVANESRRALVPGERVLLKVTEINPLKFQYVDVDQRHVGRAAGRFDISV